MFPVLNLLIIVSGYGHFQSVDMLLYNFESSGKTFHWTFEHDSGDLCLIDHKSISEVRNRCSARRPGVQLLFQQQFGEGPPMGMIVRCPQTFGYIV